MSFRFCFILNVFIVSFLGLCKNVCADYETNPFLQGVNKPVTIPTTPINIDPPVTQQSTVSYQQEPTTKEPTFIIEPPGILNGQDLNRKCLQPRGQFPSDTCNKYVNCWEGVAIEQYCPNNFLFNPIKLYCDYPANVDCKGRPISKNAAEPPTSGNPFASGLLPNQASESSQEIFGINPSIRKFCLRSTGLFPGSTCGKFVNCWDDNAVEQDCPTGLYFSSEGYCDYPENVHCAHNEENIPAKLQTKDNDCPLEFGNFRNRHNCSQYHSCAFYKVAARYNCPEGLSFSDILGICDYSYRVDCSKEPQIFQQQSIDIRGVQAKDSNCPLEFGNFRNRTNCGKYYTCSFYKVAARYDCPEGFHFSDLLGICDYSYRVDCSKEPQIFQKNAIKKPGYELATNAFAHPDLSLPASGDSRCVFHNGLVRDNKNCSSYYVCELGKVVANYVCPIGLNFNIELGVCDYADKVDCTTSTKASEIGQSQFSVPNNIPDEVLQQVQNCVPGSVFRLNPQCTSACRCRNGLAEIIQCSVGLAYDSKLDKCISAHLARC